MNSIQRISKSQYIKGLQCPKALWLYRNRPELEAPITEQKQWLFDTGNEVGLIAHACFKNGHLIDEEYNETDKAIKSTNDAIAAGSDVIFEATACSPDGAFSKIDILQKINLNNRWDLIEVKQSTRLKDYYIDDIALQRYAFVGAGYDISRSILMHLNREYVKMGEIDPNGLFILEDLTDLATSRMENIPESLINLLKIANQSQEPDVSIGKHCKGPFECDYIKYCWQNIPEFSVFNVFTRSKLEGLISKGIYSVSDIPSSFKLTDRESIAIDSYLANQVHADKRGIKKFIDTLQYPLYFLDYETIFPAIPIFDNTSPYQQIPFQFSIHVQESPGSSLNHIDFLYRDSNDPRKEFVEALNNSCGDTGSVIVYNKSFESRINKELASVFPELESQLENINNRMVDLLVPFRKRHLYHPQMNGSASIKQVLPALVPELKYDDLEISDGDMASISYLKCLKGIVDDPEKDIIYNNLRKYCELDTYAEVKLVEKLYEFI